MSAIYGGNIQAPSGGRLLVTGCCNLFVPVTIGDAAMPKKKNYCKLEGCEKPCFGYGYCNRHYTRFKKYGHPGPVGKKIVKVKGQICQIDDVRSSISETKVPERSKKLDRAKKKDYWSTTIEMAARSLSLIHI